MGNASLNISVVEKRMFTCTEAANYTGVPRKYFKNTCTVKPIEFRPGTLLYDKHDLDAWIDAVKSGVETISHAEIVDRI